MNEAASALDRISNLPDSLLHHIHSFLESKDGARTSVLSKRLNYIWSTVPTLYFKVRFLCLKPNYSETQKFMDFVDGTLHRRTSTNIDKFVLDCNQPLNDSRVHSWISNVIRGNIKELSLNLPRNHSLFIPPSRFTIPPSLFTCESLISLELYCPNFTLPKYISFPRLKRLKLEGFEFSHECWNEELFSNSPVLEELTLQRCNFYMTNFSIVIPTLKLLNITHGCPGEYGVQDCVLKINAPALVTFSFWGYVAKEFALSSLQALVEATVYLRYQENVGSEAKSQLLRALAHVNCLTVNGRTLQAIFSANDLSNNLLTFHNVKRLSICDIFDTDEGLIDLLKAVPNLESLVFVNGMIDEIVENHEDEGDAGCLFPHLKSVCFQEFAGNPMEVKWVRLILRDAKALQIMSIRHFVNAKSEKELVVDIPSFPKASPDCVIKFCYVN